MNYTTIVRLFCITATIMLVGSIACMGKDPQKQATKHLNSQVKKDESCPFENAISNDKIWRLFQHFCLYPLSMQSISRVEKRDQRYPSMIFREEDFREVKATVESINLLIETMKRAIPILQDFTRKELAHTRRIQTNYPELPILKK